jgi:hypothetical protein
MKNWMTCLPVYILVAGALSACGASSGATFNNASGNASSNLLGTTPGVLPTPTPTTTNNLGPALSFAQFGVTGPSAANLVSANPVWSSFTENHSYISTDNLLRVRVTTAAGGLLQPPTSLGAGYSGFSTNYSCASYQVDIFDDTGTRIGSQSTGMLQVPGQEPCLNSTGSASQDLNFDSSVGGGPHGGVEVRVSALQYDFYCKLLYDYAAAYGLNPRSSTFYSFWCPSKAVFVSHTVDASIQVEVNGTQFQ